MKKINPGGSKTLYVGGIYEVDKASGGSVTRTVTYYPVGGAMRINNTLYYILKDHLGSASVITDSSGVEVGEQRYYPFGEARLTTGTIYTDKLFTGQREMTGLGIYHYQARFYSPKTGRFLSADTIVPSYANPQSLNRYSYVTGNPLRYVDPSGHIPIDCYNDPSYCSNTTTLPSSPYPSPNDDNGGGEPDEPTPGGDECPNWNTCVTDVTSETIENYWDANNDFLNSLGDTIFWYDLAGFGGATLAYLTGTGVISAKSIALIFGISLLEPTFISEVLIVGGLVVAAVAITANIAQSDIQSVNNAIVQTGALQNGGSLIANADGVTITTSQGSTFVDTTLPFSAQLSLSTWASQSPLLSPNP